MYRNDTDLLEGRMRAGSLILFFCSPLLWAAGLGFQTVRTLEATPEDADHFLQAPASLTLDKEGNYYIADWTARVVFSWDAEGKFRKIYGQPGEGPGEFVFNSIGGPQGYVGAVGDQLYVFDGGKRGVEIFNGDGKYQDSLKLKIQAGRTNSFFITPSGRFVIYHASFMKETPTVEVALLDEEGGLMKTLESFEDTSFERKGENGRVSGIVIKAYDPRLTIGYNAGNDQVLVGNTGKSFFNVYSAEGELVRKVEVKLIREEVQKEDISEFEEQPWIKNNRFFSASFPDLMPFYEAILANGDDQYLVYKESPQFHRIRGILVDQSGKTLGRLQYTIGENGTLLGSHGRLLAVETDEDGEYLLREVKLGSGS